MLPHELILSCRFAKLYSLVIKRLYRETFSRPRGKSLQAALVSLGEWTSFSTEMLKKNSDFIGASQSQNDQQRLSSRQQLFTNLRYHELVFVIHQKYVQIVAALRLRKSVNQSIGEIFVFSLLRKFCLRTIYLN